MCAHGVRRRDAPREPSRLLEGGVRVDLLIVYGTASPPGRLLGAHRSLAESVNRADQRRASVLDLSEQSLEACDGRDSDQYDKSTVAAIECTVSADLVVLGSPVYRASYTGALKNYLDLLPLEALRGKPVGVVAMGGTDHHYLGVDSQLRMVLAWFGALVAPTGVYLTVNSFDSSGAVGERALRELAELANLLTALANVPADSGPAPLAAAMIAPK
ncbi:MAG: NAD(P)H-dependent oxidoreductase [Gemmatimonas sp.]|nr:NAD(P)H-dependent oxidoreductase [Gemmatimonas sp.]